ncbi:hypothetical protein GCM10023066_55720 [Nocardioides kongjuensis]
MQHPEHLAQLRVGGAREICDQPTAGAHGVRRKVVATPEGPRMQCDQAEVVAEGVVHLAGDPGPLLAPGLLDDQLALAMGLLGERTPRATHHQADEDHDHHRPASTASSSARSRPTTRMVAEHETKSTATASAPTRHERSDTRRTTATTAAGVAAPSGGQQGQHHAGGAGALDEEVREQAGGDARRPELGEQPQRDQVVRGGPAARGRRRW